MQSAVAGIHDARRYDLNTPVMLAGDVNLDVFRGPAASAISKAQFQDTVQILTCPQRLTRS